MSTAFSKAHKRFTGFSRRKNKETEEGESIMSPWIIAVLVYVVIGLAVAVVRFISYMGCRKQKITVRDAVQVYLCDVFLWWLRPAARMKRFCLYGNRLNVTGFEVIVTRALKQGCSDRDLELLKQVIFQEQQKAIAAGNSPEQEAVNRWISRINEKIERRKTGADFENYYRRVVRDPIASDN